ncbi:hypothetical protein PF004_g32802 [Phytophthora fragariae]|uniref:Uncharacterized protein n=1 Tax=Phytophthora fragariae TaxID=53985 RepID=A0A6G0M6U6_9STRA|nr:hypothetical protein PF004_g32802 [Phytophthora fragariae]
MAAAAAQQQAVADTPASAARLVAASEFTHGQLRLPSSKVCPASWSRLVAASTPRMASCRCLAGGS